MSLSSHYTTRIPLQYPFALVHCSLVLLVCSDGILSEVSADSFPK
jgi:hypothetical protein